MRTAADRIKSSYLIGSVLVAAGAAIGAAPAAHAGIIPQCEQPVCASPFSIFLNGSDQTNIGGQLKYNATTGNIWLDLNTIRGDGSVSNGGIVWNAGNGATVRVNGLSGNADPILGFSVGSTTGGSAATFSFVFDLPIAISGEVKANSLVSYSLTSLSAAAATIAPIAGKIVEGLDIDIDNLLVDFDKNVDVGDAFSVGPFGGSGSGAYTALSFFTLDPSYDVMRVNINYSLTPMSLVGLTGFVQQVIVPLPAALPLLLAGMAAFGAVARRRRLEASPI